jgi:YtcA-like protein
MQKLDELTRSSSDLFRLRSLFDGVEVEANVVDAAPGWPDDGLKVFEAVDEECFRGGGIVLRTTVGHGLSAAGLINWVFDDAAEPFQEFQSCDAHGREEGIDVTRDKQPDLYGAVAWTLRLYCHSISSPHLTDRFEHPTGGVVRASRSILASLVALLSWKRIIYHAKISPYPGAYRIGEFNLPDGRWNSIDAENPAMNARRTRWPVTNGLALALLFLTSCTRAPSFDILGSFFPAWLVCLVVAIVLTAITGWLLRRLHIPLVWPTLIYPSLTALFTFVLWLALFGR